MIDPFGPTLRVFSGAANFSAASVIGNDGNMLLLSRDRAAEVTPILVNEFMRLHRHLYFRTVALKVAGTAPGAAARGPRCPPPTTAGSATTSRRGAKSSASAFSSADFALDRAALPAITAPHG
ncbi:MAG: hypothetical protein H5U18_04825, partial [Rhodobacteraceae bacterium]|nr:hypothetical protein [Paracoccaceae bacterium]